MADTPGRNGRADAQLAGQGKHMLGLRLVGKLRRLPSFWWDQAICRQFVRLLLAPLLPGRAQATWASSCKRVNQKWSSRS
jgi:hypothetical protein